MKVKKAPKGAFFKSKFLMAVSLESRHRCEM